VQPDAGGRERAREAGEEQDDDQDQPDVIRFPDRGDGVVGQAPLPLGPGAGGEQVPDAAAEVRSRQDAVGNQRCEHHGGDGVDHAASRNWRRRISITTAESIR
jgi:hypothetical protein